VTNWGFVRNGFVPVQRGAWDLTKIGDGIFVSNGERRKKNVVRVHAIQHSFFFLSLSLSHSSPNLRTKKCVSIYFLRSFWIFLILENYFNFILIYFLLLIFAYYYPPITYYWTVPLILDHSYVVGKLTSSKIVDTKVSARILEDLKLLFQQFFDLSSSQREYEWSNIRGTVQ
jgi:hypothetical protein